MKDDVQKPRISFKNTEVAFSYLSDKELRNAYYLFKMISVNAIVKMGNAFTPLLLNIPFSPLPFVLKHTIYKHFCGGESIAKSLPIIQKIGTYNVKTILDYGAEAKGSEKDFDHTADYLIRGLQFAAEEPLVNIITAKITGLIRFELLEKISHQEDLNSKDQDEWNRGVQRVQNLCQAASEANIQIYLDAEESWIQSAIDGIVETMMETYNKGRATVFTTLQFYRHDRLEYLHQLHISAQEKGYLLALKLVRGAYMEKENDRAKELGYDTPIQSSKESTDNDYDAGILYCIEHYKTIAFCNATHNLQSTKLMIREIEKRNIEINHPHLWFAQLFGMSDNISFVLAKNGFNCAKYMPYGPVKDVIPYLLRRAQENTSVEGQMGRELRQLDREMKRRKL